MLKKISPRLWMLIVIMLLLVMGGFSQLQQSGGGGSSVSVVSALPAGSNNIGGIEIFDSGGVNKLGVNASGQITLSNTAFGVTGPLPGGTNVLGTVNTIPKTGCGNTVANQPLAAVPTVATAAFAATTCLEAIIINNTNGTSATVTISDNQGTPINDLLTFSIPANSQVIQPLWGVQFTSGVKWTASGTGLTGAMLGYQ